MKIRLRLFAPLVAASLCVVALRGADYAKIDALVAEEFAKDNIGGTTVGVLVTAASILYLVIEMKRAAALLVLIAVGGGTLISQGLKGAFARPRPELVAHLVDVQTLSFPSGHAMLSAVTYLTLGALLARVQSRRRLKIYFIGLAILLTLMIGVSRVYLGVHWPTDVLGGWCLGAAWALLCWAVMLWLQQHGQVEEEAETGD